VLFTAAEQTYAEFFLSKIDPTGLIAYVLHREHCTIDENDIVTKDLNLLGRDLATTIIVDNLSENFRLTPNNGI
jgi:TFIIF-interacting CTD phosphatase-like protein